MENFLFDGWIQVFQKESRFQNGSEPGLLDHIYMTESIVNFNHNAVGVRLL